MSSIDHATAQRLLEVGLDKAVQLFSEGAADNSDGEANPLDSCLDAVFLSNTQAFREVLIGCLLARILNKDIDITLPYASHGRNAYNGRVLDEKVVNPFLKTNHFPSSRNPFLNVFRRQAKFDLATRDGLRDKNDYDAFLKLVDYISRESDDTNLTAFLSQVLLRFVKMREQSSISLANVGRLSLRQLVILSNHLLSTHSGGLSPVLLVVAMLESFNSTYNLKWEVQHQGINVSDRSSGVSGDITVWNSGSIVYSIEVTERPVDVARVTATFRDKIAPNGILDYLFMVHVKDTAGESVNQAEKYFALGHDVNFIDIRQWIESSLVTIGASGRLSFKNRLLTLISSSDVPMVLKTAWNSAIESLAG